MASNSRAEPDLLSSCESNHPATSPGTGDAHPTTSLSTALGGTQSHQTVSSTTTTTTTTNQPDVRREQDPLLLPASSPPAPVAPRPTTTIPSSASTFSKNLTANPAMPATTSSPTEPAQVSSGTPPENAPTSPQSNTGLSEPKVLSPAIGPSSDLPSPCPKESEDAGISLVITLLLTTGARHPFKIDSRYLRKRSVNVPDNDPFAMSVYTLKELIWREWRSEWEPRPTSPSLIRLISFGKLLDDKAPLSDSKFHRDAPNVVHMTVKPQDLVDEEEAKATKGQYSRDREDSERSPGCRCVIL
ncbi:hypothetical protein PRK78_003219 [Emydomyces testavorans]|uniref:UBL3-like ubiquitin domain-containing protein n=1 Tax=Emydomyces testavorans TaxID=2070801 RepID=A0AAF0DFT5_9EURO|nr:hypothetical protein PRK78_003219 [Emydomyces testavorans]